VNWLQQMKFISYTNLFLAKVRSFYGITLAVALLGIAATLLDG